MNAMGDIPDVLDLLIVGAGISVIGAAVHLKARCPGHRFAILEGRDEVGGTWDLFRYPGVRSDSDMYTLGFSFRPWTDSRAIVEGAEHLPVSDSQVAANGGGKKWYQFWR